MKQYLYTIQPVRETMLSDGLSDDEARTIASHFEYLEALKGQGVVLLAGRTLNLDPSAFGIVILLAESHQEAISIMVGDPAVRDQVMRARLYPFRSALVGDLSAGEP